MANGFEHSNLTENQRQVWIAQALVPNAPIYNLAVGLTIFGELKPCHFQEAFQALLNSSDALRTVFEEQEGVPMQRALPEISYRMPFFDFSDDADPRAKAREWMENRCRTPFDLRRCPFDSALMRIASREFVWFLSTHHIISDAWSIKLICEAMSRAYGLSVDRSLPKKMTLHQFQDYIAFERQRRDSARRDKARDYWRRKLSAHTEPARLYDNFGPSRGTRIFRITHELGQDRTKELRRIAGQTDLSGDTDDILILNAFCALLFTYLEQKNGNQSYFIGIPSHNRRLKPFKQTIGFFSEVLPIQISIGDEETFSSLLKKIRREIFETIRHGQFAVANPVHKQIYDVVLNYHKVSFNEFGGMPAFPEWIDAGHGMESLALQVHDFGFSGSLRLDFDFHNDLFSENQARLAIKHFLNVLDTFLANTDSPIHRTCLLSSEEKRQVLIEWNDTTALRSTDQCVHRLFEHQVEATPDATAVDFNDEQVSYADLNRRANQLASYLKKLGVRPGTRVGIYVERSLEMVVGLLGTLKAGGSYVPIDSQYPAERSAFILEDNGVSLLLTQRALLERLPKPGLNVVCLDSDWELISLENEQNLLDDVNTEHSAYVIYTSGSTGKPRGVEITHKALVNFASWASGAFELGPADRVLQFSSISFDTAVEEVFPCLIRGATLVLRTDAMLDSISTFLENCHRLRLTVLDLPTGYWHELTTKLHSESLAIPETIRLMIIGGEKAMPERLAEWRKCVDQRCRLLNTYGPTEATVVATMCDLTQSGESDALLQPVPIGRPITNVRAYVLDRHLNPVPVGVAGELYIAGAGLARGYINQSQLTAEKFIFHSFDHGPQERLYKTGDRVRSRPDGNLEFLGRTDEQIKIRGFRVEPGEIEAVLLEYPAVREALVMACESQSGVRHLVAYVVPSPGANLATGELKSFLKQKLPDFLMPAHITLMESFPLTVNGKIDRRSLPAPVLTTPTSDEVFVVARTPIEKGLADIWSRVLGLEKINIHDSFFELGGHSLLATQVFSRIRDEFKVDLPLRSAFETPTIAGLANQIELALQNVHEAVERPPIAAVRRDRDLPLSFSQSRMWFMHRLAPESAAYNMAVALRLVGRLRTEALQQALNEIVRRHESVRTVFRSVDGRPRQVIAEAQEIRIRTVDLNQVPPSLRPTEARHLVIEEARKPFDLERDLLMRVLLVQIEAEDHVLLLTMHHIASDQWSLGIIARELTYSYNALCNGLPFRASPLPVQYADFAVWQRQWSDSEALKRQLVYWKERLAGLQPLNLPSDRARPAVQTFRGAYLSADLPKSLIAELKALSLEEGVTLYMCLLAAFKTLLYRYSGQTDIAVGSPIANRNWRALEGIVGTFVNTLVLRTDLTGEPTFRDLLKRVREVTIGAYSHQETPFEKVVEELQPERDTSRSPLVQVLFNFQNAPIGNVNLDGLSWSPFEFDIGASQFDLCLGVDPDILSKIALIYNPDLFETATMNRMMGHYFRLLEAIVVSPEKRISELEILSKAEEDQVLDLWNNTQSDFSQGSCVHELIQAQAEITPDAVAVVCDGKGATYRELNSRANQLARHLRALGLGLEAPVGIYMERSLEMVVGLLGILKAGGAYVPLDPDYPSQRIAYMVQDSGASIILAHERLLQSLPDTSARVVCMDRDWNTITRQSAENPVSLTDPFNLAYVIYTSGSTGNPKGVEIPHQALVNFLLSMRREPGLTDRDVMLSVTSLSFDIAALEIFLPLTVGGRVVLVSRATAMDGRLLKERLDLHGATIMQATPMTWRLLLEAGWEGSKGLKILCGGEALPRSLADALLQRGTSVWNLYGPTETTIWSTVWKVERGDGPVSIGRPIANTQVYVLNGALQPVPVGVAGEIYIGGTGIARGYRGKPELTAEKFISAPFGRGSATRLFKTGDSARYLPKGDIEYLARTDYQVKIRGYRIELGEIEAVLAGHPAVGHCVVMAKEDIAGEKCLVAYVVPKPGPFLGMNELQDYLRARLPDYMVPASFTVLKALPLTPNGKIDRQGLPSPERLPELRKPSAPPRDTLELQMARIWERVLGVGCIGINDNFFELGGHSILAVRLVTEIEKLWGVKLPLTALFGAPTIEKLVAVLRQDGIPAKSDMLVEIQRGGSKPPLFLIHGTYPSLVKRLDADQPVYALLLAGIYREAIVPLRVEEIAIRYIQAIRSIQPQGPYYLGGLSAAGVMAYEIARQLSAQGERVGFVGMFDTYGPGSKARPSLQKLRVHLAALWRLEWPEKLAHAARAVKGLSEETRRTLWRVKHLSSLRAGKPLPLSPRNLEMVYLEAVRRYAPKGYDGKVALFRAKESAVGAIHDPYRGWNGIITSGLEIHEVPGNHMTILDDPNVQALASQFLICLGKAQQRSLDDSGDDKKHETVKSPSPEQTERSSYQGKTGLVQRAWS